MKNSNINTKGSKNPNVKLTADQANDIKLMYQSGDYSLRKLGEMFNISHTQVRRIAYELSWNTL